MEKMRTEYLKELTQLRNQLTLLGEAGRAHLPKHDYIDVRYFDVTE